jgi:hypothetical protein
MSRSYITRLQQLLLLPAVTYWHEYLDLVLSVINNHTYIDESALPKIAESRITKRERNENLIRFVILLLKL